MTRGPSTTVILATTAEPVRMLRLAQAIRSVTRDQDVPGIPVVVVNGKQYNEETLDALGRRRDIRLFQLEQGGFSAALRFGRERVDTPFFCFLDDDDLYYPDALRDRIRTMLCEPQADVLITEGLREVAGQLIPCPLRAELDPRDLFRSLMRSNWLPSCGGFFRTDSVGAEFFDPDVHHLEWTYIAFRLLRQKRVVTAAWTNPHFLISDTPSSASKSLTYLLEGLSVLYKFMESDLLPRERRLLERKICNYLHTIADYEMRRGRLSPAWRAHLRTLLLPAGYRYLLFSRKLIGATVCGAKANAELRNL